jgi:hypothetical protein
LQDFPFKGQEAALKAMEEHDLIAVSFVDGRPSMVRAGKPVYRQAFQRLVSGKQLHIGTGLNLTFSRVDTVFAATCQIDQANALIAKADSDIRALEQELLQLHEIAPQQHPGIIKRTVSATWSGARSISSAVGLIAMPWRWTIFQDGAKKTSHSSPGSIVKPSEALDARRLWVLEKMGKTVQKMQSLEAEVAECKDSLKGARA